MTTLKDLIDEIRSDNTIGVGALVPGMAYDGLLKHLDRRLSNLEKVALLFLDKYGPEDETKT